jgi:hypothetical protein
VCRVYQRVLRSAPPWLLYRQLTMTSFPDQRKLSPTQSQVLYRDNLYSTFVQLISILVT